MMTTDDDEKYENDEVYDNDYDDYDDDYENDDDDDGDAYHPYAIAFLRVFCLSSHFLKLFWGGGKSEARPF